MTLFVAGLYICKGGAIGAWCTVTVTATGVESEGGLDKVSQLGHGVWGLGITTSTCAGAGICSNICSMKACLNWLPPRPSGSGPISAALSPSGVTGLRL